MLRLKTTPNGSAIVRVVASLVLILAIWMAVGAVGFASADAAPTAGEVDAGSGPTGNTGVNIQTESEPRLNASVSEETLSFEANGIDENGSYNITTKNTRVMTFVSPENGSLDLSNNLDAFLLRGNRSLTVSATDGDFERTLATPFKYDNVFDLAKEIVDPPEATSDDYGTKISHDLLFEGERYQVRIDTTDPEGTLHKEITADRQSISLPEEALSALSNSDATITVNASEGITEGEQIFKASGNLFVKNTIATLEDDELIVDHETGGSISHAWIRHGGETVNLTVSEQTETQVTFDLSSDSLDIQDGDTVRMVLVNQNGNVVDRLSVEVQTADNSTNLLNGPWIMVGLLLGGGFLMLSLSVVGLRRRVIDVQKRWERFWYLLVANISLFGAYTIVTSGITNSNPINIVLSGIGLSFASLLIYGVSRSQSQEFLKSVGLSAIIYGFFSSTLNALFFISGWNILGITSGAAYGIVILASGIIWVEASTSQRTTTESSGPQPIDVTVEVVNGVTGDRINSEIDVKARQTGTTTGRPTQNTTPERFVVEGEPTTESLSRGTWEFEANVDGQTVTETVQISSNVRSVRLSVPGHRFSVNVQTEDGKPIPGVTVSLNGRQFTDSGSTDQKGQYASILPASIDSVEITAEHELFESMTRTATVSTGSATLSLAPRQGQLEITAVLGNDPVSGIEVNARRQTEPRLEESGMTNDRGSVNFPSILIGQYDLEATLPVDKSAFSIATPQVNVEEGQTTRQNIDISFEYQLSHDQRQRIRDLRNDLQELARSSRRDETIQRYYASVIHAILDEVERLPQLGYSFLEYNQDPDAIADAVLDASEQAVAMMDDVLSSQRNVNLFSACADLPPATVEYDATTDITTLLENAGQDIGTQRSEIQQEAEAVDEQITSELRDLAEVSPAREMWDGVSEMLRDQGGLTETEVAASNFVASHLFDAIESVFERPALRKRLNQTVY